MGFPDVEVLLHPEDDVLTFLKSQIHILLEKLANKHVRRFWVSNGFKI